MAKVIKPGDILFEDDVKIIEKEVEKPLAIPAPLPVISRDEMQILYNGRVFVATKEHTDSGIIKVYTLLFSLQEVETPKAQEEQYFAANAKSIEKLKQDFISRTLSGTSGARMNQAGKELEKRIRKAYESSAVLPEQVQAGKGLLGKLTDSVLSGITGFERVMLLDAKIYNLITIPEYLSVFEKSFEPAFFKKLLEAAKTHTPEEISEMILKNSDKVHRKVLPQARNKIWHSDKSSKLYLDGTYFIPEIRGSLTELEAAYRTRIEEGIKIDAAGGLK